MTCSPVLVGSRGVQLATYDQGPKSKYAIVLLHGLTGTHDDVLMRSRLLERAGYRVIAYDARGHGCSTSPSGDEYCYEILADDLESVMNAHQVERALLVGASMGCHTALVYALRHPDRVFGALLITPYYHEVLSFEAESLAHWSRLAAGLRRDGPAGFIEAYGQPFGNPPGFESIMRLLHNRLARHRDYVGVARALEAIPYSRPYERIADLAVLRAPARVVGSQDLYDIVHRLSVAEDHASVLGTEVMVEEPGRLPIAWVGGRIARVVRAFARETAMPNPGELEYQSS